MAGAADTLGVGAIVVWSSLGALSTFTRELPPFQQAAICFAIATLVGLVWARVQGETIGQSLRQLRRVPLAALALGIGGLLGYHVCYFFALRHAPAIDVSLINYLWPLLIVLFSALLPTAAGGKPLRWWQIAGAVVGFAGAAWVPLATAGPSAGGAHVVGWAAALAAAFIWAAYSVATRLAAGVPGIAMVGACAGTCVGALAGHLALETTVWPTAPATWAALAAQGIGPVGIAFYWWDRAMKHGDVRLLGAVSYATPLLSTALLMAIGETAPSLALAGAAALVTAGAVLAARS